MKHFKRTAAVLLAVILCVTAVCSLPMTATAYAKPDNSLTVKVASNFFGSAEAFYSDLEQFEDENGDVYITVQFNLLARGKYLINFDLGELTWDPSVLEWKEAYNQYYYTFRNKEYHRLNLFPVVSENGFGTGVYNTFGDNNGGRVIGNHTGVSPAAKAYGAGNTPVSVVKAVFKVLDRTAGVTTVNCKMEVLGLCDDTVKQPEARDRIVNDYVVDEALADELTERGIVISPASQAPLTGDVDGNGEFDINDVTLSQRMLCEFNGADGKPLYDETDAQLFAAADVNGDGVFNVYDITAAQRMLAEF